MPTTLDYGIVVPAAGTEPPDIYGITNRLGASTVAAFDTYVSPSAWTPPTFTNSWVDFGGAAQVAQYRMVGDWVEVRGVIKTGVLGNSAFTLPAGFRPPAAVSFPVDANGAYGRVTVGTTGTVTPDIGAGVSTSTTLQLRFSVTA